MTEPITYPEYPDYMQAVKPSCSNCVFYGENIRRDRDDKKICKNENMRVIWLDGNYFDYGVNEVGSMGDNSLAFPPDFSCKHHELKAEG